MRWTCIGLEDRSEHDTDVRGSDFRRRSFVMWETLSAIEKSLTAMRCTSEAPFDNGPPLAPALRQDSTPGRGGSTAETSDMLWKAASLLWMRSPLFRYSRRNSWDSSCTAMLLSGSYCTHAYETACSVSAARGLPRHRVQGLGLPSAGCIEAQADSSADRLSLDESFPSLVLTTQD